MPGLRFEVSELLRKKQVEGGFLAPPTHRHRHTQTHSPHRLVLKKRIIKLIFN